jgi:hypothetical protein
VIIRLFSWSKSARRAANKYLIDCPRRILE